MPSILDDVIAAQGKALAFVVVIASWAAAALVLFLTAPTDWMIVLPLALLPCLWIWARTLRGVLVLFVIGFHGGLFLLEVSIRYAYFGTDALVHPSHYHGASIPVRRVGDSESRWTMQPGFDTIYEGTRLRINQAGFRGPDFPSEHSGVTRIVTYGSSIAVGAGIDEDEAYPVAVAKDLAALTGRPTEGLNLGIVAYGLPQLMQLAVESAASYQPDVVIVEVRAGAVIAGERGKVFGLRAPPWIRRHSFAADGLAIVSEHLKAVSARVEALVRPPTVQPIVPERPALETLQDGLTALRKQVGAHCVIVVLLMRPIAEFDQDHLSASEAVPLEKIANGVGALIVDTHPLFSPSELPDELLLFPGDMHPNASVHARVAAALAKALAQRERE